MDTRGVVVTLAKPHPPSVGARREIYAQAFLHDGRGPAPGVPKDGAVPWLDLGKGRFHGHAAHLLLDEAGRLVEFCGIGGLELEWDGRVAWQAAAGPEDVHVVLLPKEASGAGRLSRQQRWAAPDLPAGTE